MSCWNSFVLSWVAPGYAVLVDNITQFAAQVKMRLISQLINGIFRVLQKLLTYFNGTIMSTPFVPLLPVSPNF